MTHITDDLSRVSCGSDMVVTAVSIERVTYTAVTIERVTYTAVTIERVTYGDTAVSIERATYGSCHRKSHICYETLHVSFTICSVHT